jgi:acyl-CoA-dependent ceramide synthase
VNLNADTQSSKQWVMKDLPIWWYQTAKLWEGYPHWRMSGKLKTYYLLQFSYWLQQMLVLVFRMEKPRPDFRELVIHVSFREP